MDFTTIRFLVFLGTVAVLYRVIPARLRALVLVTASYIFYWKWSGALAILLLGTTAASFIAARAIETARTEISKRGVMLGLVSGLILLLTFYKSVPFLQETLRHSLIVPLGISYYTFKLISYVVDVYWGTLPAEKAFIPFVAYASFFPQIVAGPIQRSESFLSQINQARPARFHDVLLGVQRILLGYLKKFVVADNLSLLVNFIYAHVYDAGTPLILGYYAYPLQMYADFSGLTDIAVGSALLLGIESPENFNAPFSAASPSEYWRRWHITLTTWLTDYVFTPLRMATRRFGDAGLVFSLFVNMILIGVWHGFHWGFALFGAVHAIYLSFDALTARARKKYYKTHRNADRLTNWIGPVVTFHLIAVAFVFFRGAADLGSIFYLLGHLGKGIYSPSPAFQKCFDESGRAILIGFAGYLIMEYADYLRRNYQVELVYSFPRWARWSVYSCTAMTVLFVVILLLAGGENHNPFLYAIF